MKGAYKGKVMCGRARNQKSIMAAAEIYARCGVQGAHFQFALSGNIEIMSILSVWRVRMNIRARKNNVAT